MGLYRAAVRPLGDGGLHPDFSVERWVRVDGFDGRLLLGYNPHTHTGRIGVWSTALGHGVFISAAEVSDASPEAQAWIDGYLAGGEPGPAGMFGREIYKLPDSDPKWDRWRDAVKRFRASGYWTGGSWMDLSPIEPSANLVQPAWTRRGDELWEWDGSRWSPAEPQPPWEGRERPGSLCESDGHSLAVLDARHLQCENCGLTDEVESD